MINFLLLMDKDILSINSTTLIIIKLFILSLAFLTEIMKVLFAINQIRFNQSTNKYYVKDIQFCFHFR